MKTFPGRSYGFSMPRMPTIILALYLILLQFIEAAYFMREMSIPPGFDFLQPFAFVGLVGWWLQKDSRETGESWPLDMGMFLYSAWIVILPYHLFRTRGLRGLIDICLFAGVVFAIWFLVYFAILALTLDPSVIE